MKTSSEQGFTLIEVLVAIAVFGLSIYLVFGLIQSIRFNGSNMNTLDANQAIQDAFERTARQFASASVSGGTYTVVTATEKPRTVPGYDWTVVFCQGNASNDNCSSPTTLNKNHTYSQTMPESVKVVRMTVTYTPQTAGRGSPISAALEMARP